jgi:hypothetical protein
MNTVPARIAMAVIGPAREAAAIPARVAATVIPAFRWRVIGRSKGLEM